MSPKNRMVKVKGKSIQVTHINGASDLEQHPFLTKKLIPRSELSSLGDFLRRRGNKIAFTTGVFDMLHIGHARYLQLASTLGDVLVVAVNADVSVKRLKGNNRPILDQNKRAEMVSFLAGVNYITYFEENNGAETIKLLKPDAYLCVEGSWEGDIATKEEVKAMAEIDGHVYYAPRQGPTISTSAIIDKIGKDVGQKLIEEMSKIVTEGFRF